MKTSLFTPSSKKPGFWASKKRKYPRGLRLASMTLLLCGIFTKISGQSSLLPPAFCKQCGNYFTNGSFEFSETGAAVGGATGTGAGFSLVECGWTAIYESPDVYGPPSYSLPGSGCTGQPPIPPAGLAALSVVGGIQSGTWSNLEGVQQILDFPMVAEETYNFSMQAMACGGPSANMFFTFFLSMNTYPETNFIFNPANSWDFATFVPGNPSSQFYPVPTDQQWITIAFQFVCPTEMDGAQNFGISAAFPEGAADVEGRLYFDDMQLSLANPLLPTLNLPNAILCPGESIANMIDYTTSGNAIPFQYQWQYDVDGVIITGDDFIYNPNNLPNPNATSVTITYSEQNNEGCWVSVSDVVQLSPTTPPIVSITQTTCPGECDGAVSITPQGIAPLTIFSNPPDADINALCAETPYTFWTTDGNGCTSAPTPVDVTSVLCCAESTLPPPTYLIPPGTTSWQNATYVLDQNLVLLAGSNFFVNNSSLYFVAGKGIIMQEGSQIHVINNSILTRVPDCDGIWKGIKSLHTSNYPNSVALSIIEVAQSEISYADTAIQQITVPGYAGGLLQVNLNYPWQSLKLSDSELINNRMDIHVKGITLASVPIKMQVTAVRTRFEINQDFDATNIPGANRIVIRANKSLSTFLDVKIINTQSGFVDLTYPLTGIWCEQAPIRYYSSGVDANDIFLSEISGFTRGIHMYVNANVTSTIKNVDFKCYRSIYALTQYNMYILANRFRNFDAPFMAGVLANGMWLYPNSTPITQEGGDITSAPYAIYMDGAQGFYIQDNDIDTHFQDYGPAFSHGVIINNTGQANNNIRRNYFHGMARALKFQGINRSSDFATGAKYKCNQFGYAADGSADPNLTDIRELHGNQGLQSLHGVPHQGPEDYKNEWNQNNCANLCFIDDIAVQDIPVMKHRYHRPIFGTEPATNEISGIIINSNEGNEDCNGFFGIPIVLGGDGLASSQKVSAESDYALLKTWYNNLVDGGNTEELMQQVLGANYSSALQTYYDLMQQSPNLSDELMIAALQQFNIPNVLLVQILASNPSASWSADVQEEIEKRPIPFTEYQKQLIQQGMYLMSSREELERAMASTLARRDGAVNCLIAEIELDDDISDKTPGIDELLDEEQYYSDLQKKVNILISTENFASAITLLETSENNFSLSRQELDNIEDQLIIIDLMRQIQETQANSLNANQVTLLENLLANSSAEVSSRALDLLIRGNQMAYEEMIFDVEVEERNFQVETDLEAVSAIRIYPNPIQDFATIEYKEGAIALIEVFDLAGKLLFGEGVAQNSTQYVLILKDLTSGLYEVRLTNSVGTVVKSIGIVKE